MSHDTIICDYIQLLLFFQIITDVNVSVMSDTLVCDITSLVVEERNKHTMLLRILQEHVLVRVPFLHVSHNLNIH
jgi:hypothetical protein